MESKAVTLHTDTGSSDTTVHVHKLPGMMNVSKLDVRKPCISKEKEKEVWF